MRPAFSSTSQAAAFALLLFFLLLSPVLEGRRFLSPREQAYSALGWRNGPYPWVRHQIFEETNDIDIAILGSSRIYFGIDTPYLQAKLSERLNRPAVVRTIGWEGGGYDTLYFISQDLLAHRHVKMLVFYDENPPANNRNAAMPMWFRYGDSAGVLAGLPVAEQGWYYLAAIIGMPRNLLGLLRPNLPAPLDSCPPDVGERYYHSASVVQLLGAIRVESDFNEAVAVEYMPIVPFTPNTIATPADVEIYSPTEKNDFEFSRAPLPASQRRFAGKLAELIQTNGCLPVMLHIPVLNDASVKTIMERTFWPDVFSTHLTLIGIPPARLFAGLTDEELHRLFVNHLHMNANGMEYFTRIMTPTLLNLYEKQSSH